MKKSVFSALLLATIALPALAQQGGSPLPQQGLTLNGEKNPDGSTTIKEPQFKRGRNTLLVSADNSQVAVCKALGFSKFLDGDQTSTLYKAGHATLTAEGEYSDINPYNSYAIGQITCYNELQPITKAGEVLENPDGTVTMMDLKYLRGSKSYNISSDSNANGICKALGFDNTLKGSLITGIYNAGQIILGENGSASINPYNSYSVKEVTCMRGKKTAVLIDANGKKYFRQQVQGQ